MLWELRWKQSVAVLVGILLRALLTASRTGFGLIDGSRYKVPTRHDRAGPVECSAEIHVTEKNQVVEEYPYLGSEDNPIESEGTGPLLWFNDLRELGPEAFFAKDLKGLGKVVGKVVKEWAGGQVADKLEEHVEQGIGDVIRNAPIDPPDPSLPVDMGTPAMGTPNDTSQEPPDLGASQAPVPDWNPGTPSIDDQGGEGTPVPVPVEVNLADDSAPDSGPVDMGVPMGVPAEESAAPPRDNSVMLPPINTNVVPPPWDPGAAGGSWFPSAPEPPPIPMEVPPDE
jgi:hypothetical protein